jgi:outer membrane protein assembly factor BamB
VRWGTRRVAAVIAVTLATAGCWPSPGAGPDRRAVNGLETAITAASAATLTEVWATTTQGGPLGDPVVSAAAVHVNGPEHLYGIDKATGARRWTFTRPPFEAPDPGSPPPLRWSIGQPVVDGDRVLAWTLPTPFNPFFPPSSVVVDAATGTEVRSPGGAVDANLRGRQLLVRHTSIGGELALVATNADDLASTTLGATVDDSVLVDDPALIPATLGAQRLYHAGEGVATTVRDDAALLVEGVRAFVRGGRTCKQVGDFIVISLTCPAWVTVLDGAPATSPVLSEDEATVWVGSAAGTVYALDAATGAVRWSTGVGSPVTAEPAVDDDRLYVPTAAGELVALDRDGGAVAFTVATGAALTVQPAVAGASGGVVITGSADGSVHAIAAGGCGAPACDPLWSADAGEAITGAPAIHGHQVFVGTAGGRLVAYRPA